jgi:hypothetical protein
MSEAATANKNRTANRTAERLFFTGMAILLCAVVVVGFSHSFFMAGMLRAKLPNNLVRFHAAVFTSWMIFYFIQSALISVRRVSWHRTVGTAAYCLAILMVPLGMITGLDELRRECVFNAITGVAEVPQLSAIFLAESLLGISLFGFVVFASWRARRNPATHKRLVLYATIGLASGALIRFPWAKMGISDGVEPAVLALGFLLLLVAGYDLFSMRRIHPATRWAGPLTFATSALTTPIANTELWQSFAAFLVRTVAPHV